MSRLRLTIRRDDGFALPTVMLLMVAALAITSAIVVSSLSAQGGTVRDQRSKLALAAGETGISDALSRYNRVATSNAQPCLIVSAGGSLVGSGASSGWCNPVTGSSNGGTYSYRVRPTVSAATNLTSQIKVVSTGNVGGVTRRVQVTADSASGTKIFCPTGVNCHTVQAQNGINLNSNAELRAGAATNGSITLSSNAKVCGPASVGLGQQLTLVSNAKHYADNACTAQTSTYAQAPLSLPPVNQGDAATSNDNVRLTNADNGSGSPADVISGNRNNVDWNPTTRQLSVTSNTGLTLTGAKYSLCKLTLSSNVILTVASTQSVSIFFDSPEACGLANNTAQVDMSSNTRITAGSGAPTGVAMYFVGSPSLSTRASFSSNTQVGQACNSNFVIYAPRTDVLLNSNATYCGALAAKSLQMDSNARIFSDAASADFTLASTGSHFSVSRFVECNASLPAGATSPDGGC